MSIIFRTTDKTTCDSADSIFNGVGVDESYEIATDIHVLNIMITEHPSNKGGREKEAGSLSHNCWQLTPSSQLNMKSEMHVAELVSDGEEKACLQKSCLN